MILEKTQEGQEFTEDSLLEALKKKYKTKKNGKEFEKNDIVQYLLRGNIAKSYGGNKITAKKVFGIKILYIEGNF